MSNALSRRKILGGAAVAVSLPYLSSVLGRRARAAEATCRPPKRFLAYFFGNGCQKVNWTPPDTGRNYTLSPSLEPLGPVKGDVFVPTGLVHTMARPHVGCSHESGSVAFLTGVNIGVARRGGVDMTSVDQKIADAVGSCTRLASLQLGLEFIEEENPGRNYISYRGRTPLPPILNAQLAFDRLFQGTDPKLSAGAATMRASRRTSVLDFVAKEARDLASRLGPTDRHRVDEYLTGVRELEQRLGKVGMGASGCVPPSRPAMPTLPFPERLDVFHELIALGFQCDVTRVISFMKGGASSRLNHAFINASGGHHGISHHGNNKANTDKLKIIDRWQVQQFAKLLQRLKAPDADGKTVLDNSVVFYGSEISDGDKHDNQDTPILLAGRLGGAFSPGQHVKYAGRKQTEVMLAILRAFGVNAPQFGDADKPLEGLGPV